MVPSYLSRVSASINGYPLLHDISNRSTEFHEMVKSSLSYALCFPIIIDYDFKIALFLKCFKKFLFIYIVNIDDSCSSLVIAGVNDE